MVHINKELVFLDKSNRVTFFGLMKIIISGSRTTRRFNETSSHLIEEIIISLSHYIIYLNPPTERK